LRKRKEQSEKLIDSGKALDKFRQMVELQGGDPRTIDDPKKLPEARHTMTVSSPKSGYLAGLQCEQVGTACVILGGGREQKEDSVDPAVGIVLHKKIGEAVPPASRWRRFTTIQKPAGRERGRCSKRAIRLPDRPCRRNGR